MPLSQKTAFVLLACLIAGCGPNAAQPGNRAQAAKFQMPAPKELAPPPAPRAERLDTSLQADARAQIRACLTDVDPIIRSQAIEAAQKTIGVSDKSIFLNALRDQHPQVRFAACLAVGQLRIREASDLLRDLINDKNLRVGIAARFALHCLGDTTYSKELESTAVDVEPRVRSDTALVLGLLGEPSAVNILKPMLKDREPAVRIQAAEALWKLHDELGYRCLEAYSKTAFPDERMVAMMALAGPRDRRALPTLRISLTAEYTEVCLMAALTMGMCGSDAGYGLAIEGAKSADPRQRSLAALALGEIGRTDSQSTLASLLRDKESASVRVAAAKAILQLKPAAATARGE